MKKIFFILIIALTVYPLFAVDLDDFNPKNYNWGVIDTNGKEIISPQNYFAYLPVGETFNYVDLKSEDFGFADRRGRILSPLKFEEPVVLINGYGFFKKGKKYGVCDEKANIILPAEYDIVNQKEALKFLEKSLFLLWKKNVCYLFDKNGKSLFNFTLSEVKLCDDIILCADKNYKWTLRDLKGSQINHISFDYLSPFKEGFAISRIGKYYLLIDKIGNEVVLGTNDLSFDIILDKKRVLVNAIVDEKEKYGIWEKGKLKEPLKYNYVSIYAPKGEVVFRSLVETGLEFTDGEKNYVFDQKGNMLFEIAPPYHLKRVDDKTVTLLKSVKFDAKDKDNNIKEFDTLSQMEEFLNRDPNYEAETHYYYYGLFTRGGKEIIPCEYNNISPIKDDLYLVKLDEERQGVFDAKGKEIIPCDYKEITYKYGLILAKNHEATKVYDNKGKLLLDLTEKYSDVSLVGNNILVRQDEDNKYYIIDAKGNKLSKPYDAILDYRQLADEKDLPVGMGETDYLTCLNKKE